MLRDRPLLRVQIKLARRLCVLRTGQHRVNDNATLHARHHGRLHALRRERVDTERRFSHFEGRCDNGLLNDIA